MELVCSSSPPGCWFIFWIRMRWGHLKFTLHVTAGIEQIMKHSFWFLKQFSTTFFCVFYSLLTDELTIFVMPEVQTLGMGSSETFYGGHASQFHAHQLVSYPESGGEVNIQLDSFAHWGWNIVLGNAEINSGLESWKSYFIRNSTHVFKINLLMLIRVRLSPIYSSTSLHLSSSVKWCSHKRIFSPSSRFHVIVGLEERMKIQKYQ